jgi:hypothetical protein
MRTPDDLIASFPYQFPRDTADKVVFTKACSGKSGRLHPQPWMGKRARGIHVRERSVQYSTCD